MSEHDHQMVPDHAIPPYAWRYKCSVEGCDYETDSFKIPDDRAEVGKEFVATILLYTPSNLPIAIRINMEWRGSGVGSAFAYAVFLMLIVAGTFALSRRVASRTM